MERRAKVLGCAKRVRVRTPLVCRAAWDCRPFGLGRVVAPVASGVIEIAPGVELDLSSGEVRANAPGRGRLMH